MQFLRACAMDDLPETLRGTDPQSWSKGETEIFLQHRLGDSAAHYKTLVETGVITGEVLFYTSASDLIEYYAFAEEHADAIKGTSGKILSWLGPKYYSDALNFAVEQKRQRGEELVLEHTTDIPAPSCQGDHFPYGDSNFFEIRQNKQFFVDNTKHILNIVENYRLHQIFLRPPRWGKSLFLNMLECYLDINSQSFFDVCFQGTAIYADKEKLQHNNKYHVMKLDLSIDIGNGSFEVIYAEIQAKIELSVWNFCKKYNIDFRTLPGSSAFTKLQAAVGCVKTAGGKVYILVDEYDRFANKLMFENPEAYVAGQTGDALSSPVRSLFETFKTLKGIRTFTTGLSPIALADVSGVNFIEDISDSPSVGSLVGFSEQDVRTALQTIFGDKVDLGPLLTLVKPFYNGFHFRALNASGITDPLYHTQLCLYFFKRLCVEPKFRQQAFAGTLKLHQMIDKNAEVGENVINLLIRQTEFAGVIAELASGNLVMAEIARSFRLREFISEVSSPDLLISFMRWHGLLTMAITSTECYRIPNRVVGDANVLLHRVVAAKEELTYNVRSLINAPTNERLWDLHNEIFSKMGSRFDHAYSEGAVVSCVEAVLLSQAVRQGFQIFCEFVTVGKKRSDLVLIDPVTKQLLVLEYKRLRPGNRETPPDLELPSTIVFHATSVAQATSLLEDLTITEAKQRFHGHATSVKQLLFRARGQAYKYGQELTSGRCSGYQCTTAVVIHATSMFGGGFETVIGIWINS